MRDNDVTRWRRGDPDEGVGERFGRGPSSNLLHKFALISASDYLIRETALLSFLFKRKEGSDFDQE